VAVVVVLSEHKIHWFAQLVLGKIGPRGMLMALAYCMLVVVVGQRKMVALSGRGKAD
jgi:hypothetical protein